MIGEDDTTNFDDDIKSCTRLEPTHGASEEPFITFDLGKPYLIE